METLWDDDVFEVFYTCYQGGKTVPSSQPQSMIRTDMVQAAPDLLREAGDFFGVIDTQEVVLQFVLCDDHRIRVEMPVAEKRGSMVKILERGEFPDCLSKLPLLFKPEFFKDFEYQSWQ